MQRFKNKLYYSLKPLIPRRLQLFLRRLSVRQQLPTVSHLWPIDERAAMKPPGWKGWPGGKKFAFVLTHDVDTQRGHDRSCALMEVDESFGFKSSFNFVPERYAVSPSLREVLVQRGFEVGVHGLRHDGKYFNSRDVFKLRAKKINYYLREWNAVGFRAPAMHHNLDWFHDLAIEYDASTFDTDPFEPHPDGMRTIFPFRVNHNSSQEGYTELPYTLPQDFTLFILMREKTIDIWKKKLDWIVANGGMALLVTHPDYISFSKGQLGIEEYPVDYYKQFLTYLRDRYDGQYWNALPCEVASCFSWAAKPSVDEEIEIRI